MSSMHATHLIICSHDTPDAATLHSRLKCRQINLVQCTVANLHVNMSAPEFLIIQGIMFHAGSNSVFLYSLNIRYTHFGSQIRILSHIFKVTAIERRTIDVHTRSQQHILLTVTGFFADSLSILSSQRRIPACSQTSQRRKSRTTVACPSGISPVVPVDFGTNSMRTITHP